MMYSVTKIDVFMQPKVKLYFEKVEGEIVKFKICQPSVTLLLSDYNSSLANR